jgi:hypothetical protein
VIQQRLSSFIIFVHYFSFFFQPAKIRTSIKTEAFI